MTNYDYITALNAQHTLPFDAWVQLISTYSADDSAYATQLAQSISQQIFGKQIYFRGVIEFTNYCKNDCYYCGIRHGNTHAARYRLTQDDILACCDEGYAHGFRTFVLQGGEDPYFTDDRLIDIVSNMRAKFPSCAITLSVGERSRASYQRLFNAGANRYLLRHETANAAHYALLHPASMGAEHRMQCLRSLKDIGYQTGCGFMVGTPHQTAQHLAQDMAFIGEFRPQMIGVGPFIPHRDTPFCDVPAGSVELSLFLLSLCRIQQPTVLLPATTALGTMRGNGRQLGVLAGCNVVMPNLSPLAVRKKYMLYNDKAGTNDSAEIGIQTLTQQMKDIGYTVYAGRGDYQEETAK